MRYLYPIAYFLLFFSFFGVNIYAQINEGFDDGDFSNNPSWEGTDTNFTINSSLQLQLNDAGYAATSYLSTQNIFIDSTEWQLYVKLSFSPSSQNYARIYLVADQKDVSSSSVNGYFLQLGESGSADAIDLYRKNGSTETLLISGIDGHVANSTNTLRIKVTRSNNGLWKLYADTVGESNFSLEGSAIDSGITNAAYFGILCTYTSSNATKFYFDDIYVGNIIVDTLAPSVVSVKASSSNTIAVEFSEVVAQSIINYDVDNGIGSPVTATADANNPALIYLTFSNSFVSESYYNLSVIGVQDLSGNVMADTSILFSYYVPQSFDVLINEIMADPSPSVGLPEYEYVELYNSSDYSIDLNGWTFTAGSTTKEIGDISIDSNEYLILTSDDAEWLLTSYGTVVVVDGFPSITNDGQTLILHNANGAIMHSVSYSTDSYQDDAKEEGGWSLEQIDPTNPCGEENNWKASISSNGGTPGTMNSVYAINPDENLPELERISVIDSVTIQLFFSEPLDSTSLYDLNDYSINNTIGNPILSTPVSPDYSSVLLNLSTALKEKTTYYLTINDTITDCVGNSISFGDSIRFAIPEEIDSLDIVMNEVLYNAKDDGVEWVEIYNRSSKVLDISELALTKLDESTGTLETPDEISSVGILLFPSEYMVLSTSSSSIQSQYYTTNSKGFVDMESFPSLNDDEGSIVLARKNLTVIDQFEYSDEMQFELLSESDGVSLERIDYNNPTQDENNWHSAAANVGYATPAYENSQFQTTENSTTAISLQPQIFSPDNDGYNDIVNISYNFEAPGFVANITIYDAKGRLVKRLVKNELLGTSGTYTWDGISDAGEKARIGIYIVYFESFDLEGNSIKEKLSCVVGGKL